MLSNQGTTIYEWKHCDHSTNLGEREYGPNAHYCDVYCRPYGPVNTDSEGLSTTWHVGREAEIFDPKCASIVAMNKPVPRVYTVKRYRYIHTFMALKATMFFASNINVTPLNTLQHPNLFKVAALFWKVFFERSYSELYFFQSMAFQSSLPLTLGN